MAIEKGTYQYEALLARLNLLETLGTASESTLNALREKLGIATKVTPSTTAAGKATTTAVTAAAAAKTAAATAAKTAAAVPSITTHPQNKAVNKGSSVTFSVVASGAAPLSYQWNKGGFEIEDATKASYTKSSAALADSGSYTCTVTNYAGEITSNAATLTITEKEETAEEKAAAEKAAAAKVVTKKKAVKEELIITRTKYPKWWNDEGIAAISLSSPGSQFVITARSDYSLYIGAIVLTVSGECNITFSFGSFGSSGSMDFGGSDEPRGMVIAMGNSPAPCGSGSFMVTGSSDESVSIGGFVSYFLWKKDSK